MSTSGMRVAVIGGGVTGLVSAYVLAKEGAEVVVYEKDDTVGGRAKTATLPDNTSLDLGFMVFTPGMYPREVMELFECLKVEVELADVSLSVSLNEGKGPEWGTQKGLSSLFAQKKNLLNPWFWKMFKEISSLKHDASTFVEELEKNADVDRNETLGHFVQSRGYSDFFQKTFLIPTCGSIWSCTSDVMNFSAYTVLSFLCNNNVLEVPSVIPGGLAQSWSSQSFVNRIKAELESRGCQLKTNSQVHSVWANHEDCGVTCEDGSKEGYNGCVIATNAPDGVKILGKEATFDELRILGAFQYANSGFFLHQDKSFMPKNPTLWGSRNFIESANDGAYITYWLNNIQQSINKTGEPFLLTVNPPSKPKDTLLKWSTSLPVPSVSASKASSQLSLIQGKRRIWFAGSYQGYGFPEDGIKAGIIAAHGLLRKSYTSHNNPKHMLPSSLESGARLLVTKFLERFITAGCIILLEEGGTALTFEGNNKSCTLKVAIRVHTPQFYWKVAMEADLGFAEAYMNGDISFVDKDEGLLNFFLIVMTNTELNSYASKLKRGWWTPMLFTSILSSAKYFLKYVSSKNSLSRSRRNIAEHYDLSNELFSLYLDETMTYSCAVFKNTSEDLKSAQLRKVHMLIDKAKVKKEHHVLDIGFGWGSLAFELVKKTGCKYTGITLAEKQFEHVQSKVKEAGLENQMELILCDYRQLPKNHKYDRIISCGMIEHVGHEYMKEYFECCESLLAQNGILVLQFVAMADEKYDEQRHTSGFIKEYVFPGGCVPSLNQVVSSMAAGSRFSVVHLEEIGVHYFHTLRRWRQNFLQNKSQVLELDGFDEKFIRTWEYYFDYMGAGFKYCLLGDYQVVFNRPGDVAAFGGDPYNDVPVA